MNERDILLTIKLIKERRKALGISYQKLADMTGMSKSTLQRYESGAIKNLPVDKLGLIADALETTPAYLMGWKEVDYTAPTTFDEAIVKDELINILIKSKSMINYFGFNIDKLNEDEIQQLSKDLMNYLHILGFKYKRD